MGDRGAGRGGGGGGGRKGCWALKQIKMKLCISIDEASNVSCVLHNALLSNKNI